MKRLSKRQAYNSDLSYGNPSRIPRQNEREKCLIPTIIIFPGGGPAQLQNGILLRTTFHSHTVFIHFVFAGLSYVQYSTFHTISSFELTAFLLVKVLLLWSPVSMWDVFFITHP